MGPSRRAGGAPPDLPALHVRRPRLERLLLDGRRRPVTFVSAAAGAGKTTLLASWAHHREAPVAWLALDERVNRPGAFTAAVVAALGSPLIGGSHDDIRLLDRTVHELRGNGARTVLVLDGVGVLKAPAVAVLDHIVRFAPPWLDVVLSSRGDPPLPVGRLRLEERLGEIRDASLAFRLAEADELFAASGVRVPREALSGIHARTEGWAAGLRLFARSMDAGLTPAALASDTGAALVAVEDYLVEEVLGHQDAETQQLLARTSIVDEVTPDLAVLLSGTAAAGRRLRQLRHGAVFVVEAGRDGAYRYHWLFRELLRRRLRRDDPEGARALHSMAAHWYDEHGIADRAERHAGDAEDWTLLGELLCRRWLDGTVEGHRAPPDLLAEVPTTVVAAHRPLAVVAAALAYEDGGRDAVVTAAPGGLASEWELADGRDHVLELVRARACGADEPALTAAAALVRECPRVGRWAALRRAEMDLDLGRFGRARATLAELADGDGTAVAVEAAGLLAFVHALEGRLAAARCLATRVLDVDDLCGNAAEAAAGLALALSDAQSGRPVAALAGAARVESSAVAPSRVLRVVSRVMDVASAGPAAPVLGLERAVARHPVADRALVALGVLEVQDVAGVPVLLGGPAEASLREARHDLGSGTPLVWPVSASSTDVHPRTSIELLALAALSTADHGTPAVALDHLREALALVSATGVKAPVIAPSPKLGLLLGALAAEGSPRQPIALELLDGVEQLQMPVFVEPLTEQEWVVLGFLPTLMSNQEIAGAMHLSVNTVKSHVKAVYRKLGVERRRNAVVRARQLELI